MPTYTLLAIVVTSVQYLVSRLCVLGEAVILPPCNERGADGEYVSHILLPPFNVDCFASLAEDNGKLADECEDKNESSRPSMLPSLSCYAFKIDFFHLRFLLNSDC